MRSVNDAKFKDTVTSNDTALDRCLGRGLEVNPLAHPLSRVFQFALLDECSHLRRQLDEIQDAKSKAANEA